MNGKKKDVTHWKSCVGASTFRCFDQKIHPEFIVLKIGNLLRIIKYQLPRGIITRTTVEVILFLRISDSKVIGEGILLALNLEKNCRACNCANRIIINNGWVEADPPWSPLQVSTNRPDSLHPTRLLPHTLTMSSLYRVFGRPLPPSPKCANKKLCQYMGFYLQ